MLTLDLGEWLFYVFAATEREYAGWGDGAVDVVLSGRADQGGM